MVRLVVTICLVAMAAAMPQDVVQDQAPMNYQFDWNVDDEESSNYFGQREAAVDGRVDGNYHVWLPDGRLMRVTYYVDGDSGFVPTITFDDAFTPRWGSGFPDARK
ncbi:pro-resilin-like [Oratosquilla oratoria]|uniref:pro-resilin-like n=1 Tax=Oratosquilla oratoria TaxID=337810 RepID=UPI003F764115